LHRVRRILRDVLDGAADVGAAVQRTLWALQYFDALDIVRADDLSLEKLDIVHEEPDALHNSEGADAP
jgi:hypothetical protein